MINVSVISAIISVTGAVATVILGGLFEWRRRRADREQDRRDLVRRYRDPLLQSAAGTKRQDDYNRYESLYRVSAYLGWVQILHQEAHFLDMGGRRRNRRLMRHLGAVKGALSGHTEEGNADVFYLLGGEQRAIGELMIDPDKPDRPRCMGYVAFRRRYRDDPEFAEWLSPLLEEIDSLIKRPHDAVKRLTTVHNALIDLITFLDPRKVRILETHQQIQYRKLPTPRATTAECPARPRGRAILASADRRPGAPTPALGF